MGFTLAEVLITLGIIGVVAAMTIPNLISNIKDKRTVSQLRATHSILANAIRLAEEEYGDFSGWNLKMDTSEEDAIEISKVLRQFLKFATDCGTDDVEGKCAPTVIYRNLKGSNHQSYHRAKNYYKVMLNNGSSVWWRSSGQSAYQQGKDATFFIDLNGHQSPNQVGRDLFVFNYEKGSLRPVGAPGYSDSKNCKLNDEGWGCAYFVLTNGHMKYPK